MKRSYKKRKPYVHGDFRFEKYNRVQDRESLVWFSERDHTHEIFVPSHDEYKLPRSAKDYITLPDYQLDSLVNMGMFVQMKGPQ